MARSEIAYTVQQVLMGGSMYALTEASVAVLRRGTGSPGAEDEATVYKDEASGLTRNQPLTTDSAGRIEGWLDPGKYILRIDHAELNVSYDQPIDVVDPVGGSPSTMRFDLLVPRPIPDNQSELNIPFRVNSPGRVAGVELSLYVEHQKVNDLTIELVHPNGFTKTMLFDHAGGSATSIGLGPTDGQRFHFAMDGLLVADSTLSAVQVQDAQRVKPAGDLNVFQGLTIGVDTTHPVGDWILRVKDTSTNSQIGTVISASLFIAPHYQAFLPSRQDFYDEGIILPSRGKIDFKGSGVTVADNAGLAETSVTIPGIRLYSNGTAITPQRSALNLKGGVTVADDAANGRTDVTIAAALQAQQNATNVGSPRSTVDFSGDVGVADTGSKITVNVPGITVQGVGPIHSLNFTGGNVTTTANSATVSVAGGSTGGSSSGGADYLTSFPANDSQALAVDATAGTFKLTYSGQTTPTISFSPTAAAIQTALEGLSNLDSGDVSVIGGAGDYTILFLADGPHTITNPAALTADSTLLTGNTHTATITSNLDGREIFLSVATNVVWHLRYKASISDAYKWEFLGGPPLTVNGTGATGLALSGSTATDYTNQPKITLPVGGEFIVAAGLNGFATAGTAPFELTAYVNATACASGAASAINGAINTGFSAKKLPVTLAASTVVKVQAGANAGTWTLRYDHLSLYPTRVG